MGNTRFAAFIITFNRPAVLKNTIGRIMAQTVSPELILIIDNGNSPETRAVIEGFQAPGLRYVPLPENSGPAGASHYALDHLINLGYDWIYWGDDDDPPRHTDTFARLLNVVGQLSGEDIGAVAEVGQRFDWQSGTIVRLADHELSGVVDVDVIAGNSQFIVKADAVRRVGLPKRELFFGYEEPELCLRMRRHGCRLLVDGERMKEAREATGRFGVPVKGSSLDCPLHALWRNYYSARNYIYIMRTGFDRNDLACRQAVKECIKSVLSFRRGFVFGLAFAKMSLLGVFHGYAGKMGKTIEPLPKTPEAAG